MRKEQLQRDILFGQKAEEILSNEAFKASCEKVEADTIDLWAKATTPEARELHWHSLQAIRAVHGKLRAALSAKLLAETELKRINN